MDRRNIFRLILALIFISAVAGLAWYAYNLGIAQGLAEGATFAIPEGSERITPYYGGQFFFRPFGFGFLACLVFPLFFFLLFGLGRVFFWGGSQHRFGWHPGDREGRVPPGFEEWHRRMHEPEKTDSETNQ